jgi:hypothetical protein
VIIESFRKYAARERKTWQSEKGGLTLRTADADIPLSGGSLARGRGWSPISAKNADVRAALTAPPPGIIA